MTVYELVQQLNEHASHPDFTLKLSKVHTHGDFHALVRDEFQPLVKDYLTVGTWELSMTNNRHRIPITYDRTFQEYKNCKWASRGRFSDLKFKHMSGYGYVALGDLTEKFKSKEKEEEIQFLKKSLGEHEAMIKRIHKELKALGVTI